MAFTKCDELWVQDAAPTHGLLAPPAAINRTLDTHAYKNILPPSHTLISYFRLFCLATYYYLTVHSPSFCHPLPHPPSFPFDTYILTPLSVFMCIGVVLLVCRVRCLCTTLYFSTQLVLKILFGGFDVSTKAMHISNSDPLQSRCHKPFAPRPFVPSPECFLRPQTSPLRFTRYHHLALGQLHRSAIQPTFRRASSSHRTRCTRAATPPRRSC